MRPELVDTCSVPRQEILFLSMVGGHPEVPCLSLAAFPCLAVAIRSVAA